MNTTTGEIYPDLTIEQFKKLSEQLAEQNQELAPMKRMPLKTCPKCSGTGRRIKGTKFKPCSCTQ